MAARPHLRAVPVAPAVKRKSKRTPHTVATAAKDGDKLDLLIAMRDRIAKAVSDESCPPRDLAALTRRLDDIVEKIGVLEAAAKADAEEVDGDDDEDSFDATAI